PGARLPDRRRDRLPVLLSRVDRPADLAGLVPERFRARGQDVAADLDLTAARPGAPASDAGRWLGLALLGLGAVVVVALTGWAAVALVGCVVVGAGLTYLSGLPLTLEERLAYGTVVGAVAVTAAVFLLASAIGMSLVSVLGGLAVAAAAAAPGW